MSLWVLCPRYSSRGSRCEVDTSWSEERRRITNVAPAPASTSPITTKTPTSAPVLASVLFFGRDVPDLLAGGIVSVRGGSVTTGGLGVNGLDVGGGVG